MREERRSERGEEGVGRRRGRSERGEAGVREERRK